MFVRAQIVIFITVLTHFQMKEIQCSNQEIQLFFEHWFKLKLLKMSPELFTWCYIQKALRTRLIISPMILRMKTFCMVKLLWRRYVVRKFSANPILFRVIQCKKGIF